MKLDTDKHGLFSRLLSVGSNAYGFAGELTDGNGLVYLRARYLAPALGTFASRDPWRGSASAPRTWNGYAWVEGNVVNRVDPGGMQSATPTCESTATSIADILQALQPTQVPTPTNPASSCAGAAYFLDPRCQAADRPQATIYLGGSGFPVDTLSGVTDPIEQNRLVDAFAQRQGHVWAEIADAFIGIKMMKTDQLSRVQQLISDEYVGYDLRIIGYSAGADTAVLLARWHAMAREQKIVTGSVSAVAILGGTMTATGWNPEDPTNTDIPWQESFDQLLRAGTIILVLDDLAGSDPDWTYAPPQGSTGIYTFENCDTESTSPLEHISFPLGIDGQAVNNSRELVERVQDWLANPRALGLCVRR